jgi:beta-phosphoglucomutase family hydrolase
VTEPVTDPEVERASAVLAGADAVLFDLDGVLTDTASVHMAAWRRLFTGYFSELLGAGVTVAPYTEDDYFRHIDGKPRVEGVKAMLVSRGLEVPLGAPEDGPEVATVHGLSTRKNAAFLATIRDGGVIVYPGSVRLVEWLRSQPVRCGVVSSSRNAREVLEAAGLSGFFDVVVDGVVAMAQDIEGKPAPDTFVLAARELGANPRDSVVVEDAITGVQAGRSGAFHVVAVDRGAGDQALREAGADWVVDDLGDLVPSPG